MWASTQSGQIYGTSPPPQKKTASTSSSIIPAAGTDTASLLSRDLEFYAIRLEPEQSLRLYGLFRIKKTLTWRDVVENRGITMRACVQCGVPTAKLYRMQPDLKEWIRHGKATAQDCVHMGAWRPNPFVDLGCSIGDLVLHRHILPPTMLIQCGLTFEVLVERYGLTTDLMIMLRYSADDWVALGVTHTFLTALTDEQWKRLFGLATRAELLSRARNRRGGGGAPPRDELHGHADGRSEQER